MVLQLITSLNLVSLHRVDPTHTKTFQVLYDAIGAVGYNLKLIGDAHIKQHL